MTYHDKKTIKMANYADEEWKTLTLEGYVESENYQISNYGRVRRFKHHLKKWKILKPTLVNGYCYMSFRNEKDWKIRKTFSLHRLTAEYFLPRPKNLDANFVIHLDYDKTNNDIKNMMWVDQKGLTEHNKKNPKVINSGRKGIITYSKLTETDVIRLKRKIRRGKNKLYKLAKEFGITHTQLNRIRSGENWGHVKLADDDPGLD